MAVYKPQIKTENGMVDLDIQAERSLKDGNGDTISTTYVKSVNNTTPDANGNVNVSGGGGSLVINGLGAGLVIDANGIVNIKTSKNMFDKNKAVMGCAMGRNGGYDFSYPTYFVPLLIQVKPNTTYTLNWASSVQLFNYDKTFTRSLSHDGTKNTFTTQQNEFFIQFNCLISDIDSVMLCEGNEILPYEAYYNPYY